MKDERVQTEVSQGQCGKLFIAKEIDGRQIGPTLAEIRGSANAPAPDCMCSGKPDR